MVMGERKKNSLLGSGEFFVVFDGESKTIKFKSDDIPCDYLEFDGWSDDTKGGLITPALSVKEVSYSCGIDKSFKGLLYSKQAEGDVGCIVTTGLYINRPKNLKHPNKKRAHRVWNKWRKRYGIEGGKALIIPSAKVELSEDGATTKITIYAKDIHQEG